MKVEIKQNVGNEVLHFPKLMISDVTNRVVLFTEPKVGINIKEGDFKDRWDMTQFKDFKGTITITQ